MRLLKSLPFSKSRPRSAPPGLHPLRSFGHRDFRILWLSALLWAVGTWLQRLAVSWLILTMTGSAFLVALSFGLYFMPNLLLGPISGAVADRVNRKALVVAVQGLNLLASVLLTFIVIADVAQVWSVLGISLLFGIGMSFGIPTTQALVYDVVGPRDAHNGIALQSVVMRFVGALGAVAGGVLIETLGFGAAFLAAASSYGLGLFIISQMGHRPIQRLAQSTSVMFNLMEGFKLFIGNRFLATFLVMAMVAEAFGYGAIALLPLIASDEVLGVGAGGLGIMNGAMSFGATLGALSLAASTELKHKGTTLLAAFLFCGLLTGGYSQSGVFPLTLLLLGGFGLAQGIFDTLEVILLQQNVPDEMRGRIMGAWTFCIGVGPIGALSLGFLAERIGVQNAVGISGALLVLAAIMVAAGVPRLRTLS